MRLIDADALIISLAKDRSALVNNHVPYGELRRIDETIWKVAESPTISAVPVVRGEWIAEQKGAEYCEFRCSACDESVGQTDQFDETEVKQFSEWYKYCPACGAKMK